MRGTGFRKQLQAQLKGVAFMEHDFSVKADSSIISKVRFTNQLVRHTHLQFFDPLYISHRAMSAKKT